MKFMCEKMLILVVLMMALLLSCFVATISAQNCKAVILGKCGDDKTAASCCAGIASALRDDSLCTCQLFSANMTVLVTSVASCNINVDVKSLCGTSTSPPSTTFTPPPPPASKSTESCREAIKMNCGEDDTDAACCGALATQLLRDNSACLCQLSSITLLSNFVEACRLTVNVPSLCGTGTSPSSTTLSPPPPLDSPSPPSTTLSPPPPSAADTPRAVVIGKPPSTASGNPKVIVAVAVPSALVLVAIAVVVGLYCRKKRRNKPAISPSKDGDHVQRNPDDIVTLESLQYDWGTLEAATRNFSDENKIGQGGFGEVYKGVLPNGLEVAVKRLSKSSSQGGIEFTNEVSLVATLKHRNLVKLLGFCLRDQEKLLVYEFMPNKSLDFLLFDPEKQTQLDWPCRYNIIKGVARGMLYLHQDSPTRIIHRDLKAANVLLDTDMEPRVADFGMAKTFDYEHTHCNTSRVVGTQGYMAPEYLIHGQYNVKSDVYSFGVLVLEIVSGKRISAMIHHHPGSSENLLSYAWKCWSDGRALELMDATLGGSYTMDEIMKCIHLGLLCVQEDAQRRPKMSSIVLMFSSHFGVDTLPQTLPPAFMYSGNREHTSTTDTNTAGSPPWSAAEASMTQELYPR